jgi:hypothetical protein
VPDASGRRGRRSLGGGGDGGRWAVSEESEVDDEEPIDLVAGPGWIIHSLTLPGLFLFSFLLPLFCFFFPFYFFKKSTFFY